MSAVVAITGMPSIDPSSVDLALYEDPLADVPSPPSVIAVSRRFAVSADEGGQLTLGWQP